MMNMRLLLVDDHSVVRSGLSRLIDSQADMQVVAEAENGEDAYKIYDPKEIDIIVMDLSMGGMGGMESARRIISKHSAAKIIIFSMHDNSSYASQALKVGVKGYVAKTGSDNDLIDAINEVANGKVFVSAEIAKKIVLENMSGEGSPLKVLSPREFEIFRLFTGGHSTDVIGERLKISQKTVANYYTMIKQKLGVSSPIEMVKLAIRHGVIDD